MYFLDLGAFQIVGSSPEILTRLEDGVVTVRPIAGTRRRGQTDAEDQALEAELLADPKELAEHLMLIDLGRNDVGRVARIGSVRVTDRMIVERYSHVMHIVSNVVGELRDGMTAIDVLRATFPAGTVSGAPKIRAMEIIDELEPVKRGVYSGAVGYIGWNGNMDTAIAIRTAVIKDGSCTSRRRRHRGRLPAAARVEETMNKAARCSAPSPWPRRHRPARVRVTAVTTLETLRQRKAEIESLAQRHGAHGVRIFGSVARGEDTEESDIDVLVEMTKSRAFSTSCGSSRRSRRC